MRSLSLASLAAAALLLSASGCDQTVRSLCEQRCACQPCTDGDMQACLDQASEAAKTAETKRCTAQLDAVLTCLDENLSCQSGSGPGTDQCNAEQETLFACAGLSNPFATPCEEAALKTAGCTGQMAPPVTGSDCPAISVCSALCILKASCDVITGATFSEDFQNCINVCNFK